MSTKIYNGCKFKNSPKNLNEVRDAIYEVREKARAYYREKYIKLIARDIVDILTIDPSL